MRLARRMHLLALLLTATLAFAGCRFESVEEEDLQASIESLLGRYSGSWNAGDLDGLMQYYAEGASAALMTPDGPAYGRVEIRAALDRRFADETPRPDLRFEDVRVRQLPPLIGIVTGRYVAGAADGPTDAGWFTFVVRRASDGWRIVHDHPGLGAEWN